VLASPLSHTFALAHLTSLTHLRTRTRTRFRCTLVNAVAALSCGACGLARPRDGNKKSTNTWLCSCWTINPTDEDVCRGCGKIAPNLQAAVATADAAPVVLREHVCGVCDRGFETGAGLTSHLKSRSHQKRLEDLLALPDDARSDGANSDDVYSDNSDTPSVHLVGVEHGAGGRGEVEEDGISDAPSTHATAAVVAATEEDEADVAAAATATATTAGAGGAQGVRVSAATGAASDRNRFAQAVSVAGQASKAWCDFIQPKEMPVWVNACSRVIRELMSKKHEA
jgi:hypothetical protein